MKERKPFDSDKFYKDTKKLYDVLTNQDPNMPEVKPKITIINNETLVKILLKLAIILFISNILFFIHMIKALNELYALTS